MKWKQALCVTVALCLIVGASAGIPLAKAVEVAVLPIGFVMLEWYAGNASIRTGGGSVVPDNAGSGGAPITGGVLYLDGAVVGPLYGLVATAGGVNRILRGIIWQFGGNFGGQDNLVHTFSWNGGDSGGYGYMPSGSFSIRFKSLTGWHSREDFDIIGGNGPLTVSIAGPSAVDLTAGGTWVASVSGGSGPATINWLWGKAPPHWAGTQYDGDTADANTFNKVFASGGSWTVECQVTDSTGMVFANMVVNASVVVGSYHAVFSRYGSKGQSISVKVYDSTGAPVVILSTDNTEYGQYRSGVSGFFWQPAESEAAQDPVDPYKWVWDAGGFSAYLPPPTDMWMQGIIYIGASPIGITFCHHFTANIDGWSDWSDDAGGQMTKEAPPGAGEALPVWLQPVYDMFVGLVRYLFVPQDPDVQAFAQSVTDSAFNPFSGMTWASPASEFVLLQGSTLGVAHDITIDLAPFAESDVMVVVRYGFKFVIAVSVVMLVLGSI